MPDNQSAMPVSQRAREAAIRYFEENHTASAKWMREGAHHPLMDAFARFEREHTAEVDALRAERYRLREAVNAALNWIDNDDCSQMGPAEDAAHTRLIRRLESALTDATNRGEG